MRGKLTAFEKRLCNALQNGLAIIERPYAKIGRALGSDEETAIRRTRGLVERGVIRRIGAVVSWRAIGKAGTLVAARVAKEKLKEVVSAVNAIAGVSHNYLREHHFNLWFTIRADSDGDIERILKNLSQRFGVEFHSLPAKRIFKLDVRFDAQSGGRRLLPISEKRMQGNKHRTMNNERRTSNVDEIDEWILAGIEGGLEVVERPYDFLCADGLQIDDVLSRIDKMIVRGVIHRVGAVVDHRKLGFVANAMFVCEAKKNRAGAIGKALARLQNVSHCYQRETFKDWPYNLFAMMHGKTHTAIRHVAERFVREQGIEAWEVLATVEKLKK